MKTLFTITAYPPANGGAQIHTHQLAQRLKPDHQVEVISFWDQNRTDWLLGTTLRAPSSCREYQIDGIPVHLLGFEKLEKARMAPLVCSYYLWMTRSAGQLAEMIRAKIEVLIPQHADLIHNVRVGREPLSLASLQLARKWDIPFVLTPVHHPRWKGWRYRVYQQIYLAADGVIALTQAEKSVLAALGIREEKIFVTGIGPVLSSESHPQEFRTKHKIDGPIVLFLGQHFPYKGYQQLVSAAPIVWEKIKEAHFVFIGPAVGASENYFRAHRDPRILRLGTVTLQEKTDALSACDLLCVPSTQESFGGVYTEAWSFKKPVIGCSIPAVREVIDDGVDGYLVEQDSRQIAERIIDLLEHASQSDCMGEMGCKKVKERYSWERVAGLTSAVYQRLKGNG